MTLWGTTYYNTKGYACGTSTSNGTNLHSYGNYREWETTYCIPQQVAEQCAREIVEREIAASAEREKNEHEKNIREARERTAREAQEKALQEARTKAEIEAQQRAVQEAKEKAEILKLKKYYISQACFFNASSRIFEGKKLSMVLLTLKNRARKNPDGASAKTLQQFSLKNR